MSLPIKLTRIEDDGENPVWIMPSAVLFLQRDKADTCTTLTLGVGAPGGLNTEIIVKQTPEEIFAAVRQMRLNLHKLFYLSRS